MIACVLIHMNTCVIGAYYGNFIIFLTLFVVKRPRRDPCQIFLFWFACLYYIMFIDLIFLPIIVLFDNQVATFFIPIT